ncbi:RNA polymerase sigma factor [Maricurvus nonylphenolicus]|uniref:RNA polymerase sigma factor n=1 Tax=Maricurvus nonylphenolicus TaxID=1008307 RepID=UPI0036F30996
MIADTAYPLMDTALANKEHSLQDNQALNQFLASVERRALRMAEIAVGNGDDALDIVQDSMINLVKRYSDKPADQWAPLFYRVLNNRIIDHHRRGGVIKRFQQWLLPSSAQESSLEVAEERDFAEEGLPIPARHQTGEEVLASEQRLEKLEVALAALPNRQQQAFMLRCWEGLSTRETAMAMDCSEGSVKTHYSRAIHQLRAQLEGVWP